MLQIIEGKEIYVVEFDTLPELPITWTSEEEKPYAIILATALSNGTITEPGKYGLEFTRESETGDLHWQAYLIEE